MPLIGLAMPAIDIKIVKEAENVAFIVARNGRSDQFRLYNDICNELVIRFVPALRQRAAPIFALPALRDRLAEHGIEFDLEPDDYGDFPRDRPSVLLRLCCDRVHLFLAGIRAERELFVAFRQIFAEAKIPFDKEWAAYVFDLSGPVVDDICEKLLDAGFRVDVGNDVVSAIAADKRTTEQRSEEIEKRIASLQEKGLGLYPYQTDGVRWLDSRHRGLLADEMGLGKTAQALVALPGDVGVLVVCPAVAKGVWRIETEKWRPDLRVAVLSGRGSFRWPEAGELVAVNYEVLPKSLPEGTPERFVLICDEAHAVKNPDAKRSVRFKMLAEAARKANGSVWLLTGTPLLNHPQELWTVLSHAGLHTEAFGSWTRFRKLFGAEYVEVGKDVWAVEWGEPSPDVRACLGKVMLRRKRLDVLSDLPAKRYQTIVVDKISAATFRACEAAEKALAKLGVSLDTDDEELLASMQKRLEVVLGKVSAARKALSRQKGRLAVAIVEEHEEQETPLVVFSAFRPVIDTLGQRDGWAAITGDTPSDARADIQEAFQSGQLQGVAATIRSGGTALTLTHASHALFVDLEWTPGLNIQAEDRLCRIGQKSSVLITQLVADVALDRRLSTALTRKSRLLEATGLSA